MRKAILSAMAVLILAIPLSAAEGDGYTPTISVSGSAEVSMKPDTASFSITASFTRGTTSEASAEASAMIGDAIAILTGSFGITEEDLETSFISASPEYRWVDDERVLVGQKATQTLEVSVHDLDSIGGIYDQLMSLSGITLSDVTLDKEDKSEAYREARMKAVLDARAKADAFAEAAGISVGNVLSISDGSSYTAPLYRSANLMLASADSAEGSSASFYSGDISVSASVDIIYAIE